MAKKYKNITISGLPGAGSTVLAKKLADISGWKYFCGGDFMRAYAIEKGLFNKGGNLHHDATVYNDDFDRQVDFGMRKKLISDNGNVLDSWLSGFMGQGVEGTLKVLVWCSDDGIRVDRIVNRDKVNVEEAKKHIFEREEKNYLKWSRMYESEWNEWVVQPGVVGSTEKIDFWHQNLYDLVIDTYSHSKTETLELVLEQLEKENN
jgi:cytidylate kinase